MLVNGQKSKVIVFMSSGMISVIKVRFLGFIEEERRFGRKQSFQQRRGILKKRGKTTKKKLFALLQQQHY